jgi:hypothetical protein
MIADFRTWLWSTKLHDCTKVQLGFVLLLTAHSFFFLLYFVYETKMSGIHFIKKIRTHIANRGSTIVVIYS